MALTRVMITVGINLFGIMRTTGEKLSLTFSNYYADCCRRTILFSIVPLLYLFYFCYDVNLSEWTILKFFIVSITYGIFVLALAIVFILEEDDKKVIINRFPKVKFLFQMLVSSRSMDSQYYYCPRYSIKA